MNTNLKAFTLIEILLVLVILGLLAGVTYLILNPTDRLAQSRNHQREVDIAKISSAIAQYIAEPGQSVSTLGTVASCPSTSSIGTSGINLQSVLVNKYIHGIPTDPQSGSAANTGYSICSSGNDRFTIFADNEELGANISLDY